MGLFKLLRQIIQAPAFAGAEVDVPARFAEGIGPAPTSLLRQAFLETLESHDDEKQLCAASRLFVSRDYEGACDAYAALLRRRPELRHYCELQMGAAYYHMGNFEKALQCFTAARVHGADENMIDDNIWQSCRDLHAQRVCPLKDPINTYLTLFPRGKYTHIARNLLAERS